MQVRAAAAAPVGRATWEVGAPNGEEFQLELMDV